MITAISEQVAEQEARVTWSNAQEFQNLQIPRSRHYIGLVTQGIEHELTPNEKAALFVLFSMKVEKGDSFYAFNLHREETAESVKIFVCDNGELGFTAMLAREY